MNYKLNYQIQNVNILSKKWIAWFIFDVVMLFISLIVVYVLYQHLSGLTNIYRGSAVLIAFIFFAFMKAYTIFKKVMILKPINTP